MKLIKSSVLPLLFLMVCLLLAACGDSPTGSATGASQVDPCSLLSETQAQSFLGVSSIAKPESKVIGVASSCNFGPKGELNFLTVSVLNKTYSKSQFEAERKTNEGLFSETAEPVAGIGDEAYYIDGLLSVLKGDKYVIVTMVNPALEDAARLGKLKEVASQIIVKL